MSSYSVNPTEGGPRTRAPGVAEVTGTLAVVTAPVVYANTGAHMYTVTYMPPGSAALTVLSVRYLNRRTRSMAARQICRTKAKEENETLDDLEQNEDGRGC